MLILDEPANGLDPEGMRWMRELLRDFADRGTARLSSHLLYEVEAIADRLVIIGDGPIAAQGTRAELLSGAGTLVGAPDEAALVAALDAAALPLRARRRRLPLRRRARPGRPRRARRGRRAQPPRSVRGRRPRAAVLRPDLGRARRTPRQRRHHGSDEHRHRHPVRTEFAYDGGGLAKGGTATLYLNGAQVGQGRIDATQPLLFSGDETTDLGSDSATPVSDDYGPGDSTFTGRVRWVQLDIDQAAEDVDHLRIGCRKGTAAYEDHALDRICTRCNNCSVWEVEYTDEFEAWWAILSADEQAAVAVRIELLQEQGPNLRRPVVGEVKGSAFDPQMKELRVEVGPASIRVLFIFDPRRTAILLTAGDKAGVWNRWYRTAIPEADRLYEQHLEELRKEGLIPDER